MSRLLFLLVGVIAGTAVGNQGRGYGSTGLGVLVFVVVVAVGLAWFAGQRDKASAVAVAVAKAQAVAAADAEAQAAAIAQAAVHLHLAGADGGGVVAETARVERAASTARLGRHAAPALVDQGVPGLLERASTERHETRGRGRQLPDTSARGLLPDEHGEGAVV